MGQAYLVRRGGASEDTLHVASGFGGFPAHPKENTIMVEANASGTAYIQGTAPDGVTDGTIYISTTRPDKAIKIFNVNLSVSGAHVMTSGAWEFADTYLFKNDAWHFLWSGQLIYPGATAGHVANYVDTEYTEYTGGFITKAIQGGSNASASAKEPLVSVDVQGRPIADTTEATGSYGAGMYYTANQIDLTPYKTIVFEGEFTRGGTAARNFTVGAWSTIGTYYEKNLLAYTMMGATSGTKIEVDVSSINALAYIGLGLTYSKAVISRAYLIPKDV